MEVAAGLIAAEQAISTTIEGGAVAGYAIAKSTLPLKATYSRIASISHDSTLDSLRRHSHSISVISGCAYIFGGITDDKNLADSDVHIIALPTALGQESSHDYKRIASLPSTENGQTPKPRAGHTSCAVGDLLMVFGGADVDGKPVDDEPGEIWVFNTQSLRWGRFFTTSDSPAPRSGHAAVIHGKSLLVYGGGEETQRNELWSFEMPSGPWNKLPSPGLTSFKSRGSPPSLTVAEDNLYLISTGGDSMTTEIHTLDLSKEGATWHTITMPNNPLVPGPSSRQAAGLLPINTGYGRNYLLYIFGEKADGSHQPLSDMWVLQIASAERSMASVKDSTREKIGADSGETTWAEVQDKETVGEEEKGGNAPARPSARKNFAHANVTGDGFVVWGGLDSEGNVSGEAWLIKLE